MSPNLGLFPFQMAFFSLINRGYTNIPTKWDLSLQVGNANKNIIGLSDPFAHGLKCWCLEALFWRVQSEKLPWTCKAADQRVLQ